MAIQVNLLVNSYIDIDRTTAKLQYSVSGVQPPSATPNPTVYSQTITLSSTQRVEVRSRQTKQVGDLSYKWDFGATDAGGVYTFSGLTPGSKQTVKVSVSISYQYYEQALYVETTPQTWQPAKPAQGELGKPGYVPATPAKWVDGDTDTEYINLNNCPTITPSQTRGYTKVSCLGSYSSEATLYVGNFGGVNLIVGFSELKSLANNQSTLKEIYTRPQLFSWSNTLSSNGIIELNLLKSDWDTLSKRAAQWKNWKNQSYNGSEISGTSVQQSRIIMASTYNAMANALGVSNVNGMSTGIGDIITANHFTRLSEKVNGT